MKTTEITTAIIAVYGAALSTFVAVRQFLRDRVRVELMVSRNMQMLGDPRYEGMTLLTLEVTNVSHRPVTIRLIGFVRLYSNTHFLALDCVPQLPSEITDGKYITSIWNQAELDLSTIDYWAAWDSRGGVYKLREAPRFKHWKSAIQRRFHKKKLKSDEAKRLA